LTFAGTPKAETKIVPYAVNFAQAEQAFSMRQQYADYLRSDNQSVAALFQRCYDMPAYSRPYSWTIDSVDWLLHGLLKSYLASSDYFLGTLVVSGCAAPGQVWVIDGKQRLMTLELILAFGMHWAAGQGDSQIQLRNTLQSRLAQPQSTRPHARYRRMFSSAG